VLAAAATAALPPAAKPSAPSASLAAEVQAVIAATLGVRAAPTQPLMEAGMDSLGEATPALKHALTCMSVARIAQRSMAWVHAAHQTWVMHQLQACQRWAMHDPEDSALEDPD
jgi:hypothetical protein